MQNKMLRIVFFCFLSLLFSFNLSAQDSKNSKYPFFAALKVDEANVRTGPGKRYPVKWTYIKKNIALIIKERFGNWYFFKDENAEEGWIHINLISRNRFFIVKNSEAILYRNPADYYFPEYILEKGVRGKIKSCRHLWCLVQHDDVSGWIYKDDIWGVMKNEEF